MDYTFGFDEELIEPPNGGYSFIEWEDLPTLVKRAQSIVGNNSALVFGLVDGYEVESILRDTTTRESANEIFTELMEKEAIRAAAVEAMVAAGDPPRNVAPGMEKYLKADPREVHAIQDALSKGRQGREVRCSEPIPAWTCVWASSEKSINGVTPGSMSNAVTYKEPETIVARRRDDDSPVYAYKQWVFLK